MFSPLILHRIAHWLHVRRIRKIPGLLERLNYFVNGCDIGPGAKLGRGVHLAHFGSGVVIHTEAVIGDNVWINPQVVIGQNIRAGGPVPLEKLVIGNGVMIGAGAKIIATGSLEIGDGATIGANAVVVRSVPAGAVVGGIPAKVIAPAPVQAEV